MSDVHAVDALIAGLAEGIDPADHELLDAARAEFVRHGFRRTAVGDIARRARVSRPTVYRRLGDKEDIVRAVVVREVVEFFAGISPTLQQFASPVARVVEGFVEGVAAFRENDLARAVLEYEPETLADLFSGDGMQSLVVVREGLAHALGGGALGAAEGRRAVELVLRLVASLLVAPSDLFSLETRADARAFAEVYLAALVEAALKPSSG